MLSYGDESRVRDKLREDIDRDGIHTALRFLSNTHRLPPSLRDLELGVGHILSTVDFARGYQRNRIGIEAVQAKYGILGVRVLCIKRAFAQDELRPARATALAKDAYFFELGRQWRDEYAMIDYTQV